jgi:hypothetical protein
VSGAAGARIVRNHFFAVVFVSRNDILRPMKRFGKTLVCALGGLAVVATSEAVTDGAGPYEKIVARNAFNLRPATPKDAASEVPEVPAPKITLQGISSILGTRKVLFKIQTAPMPGQPAKEQSYILSEGQREDEIEVLAIDENAGTVRFNNHSVMQTLDLKTDSAKPSGGGAPAPAPGMVPRPGVPPPMPTAGVPNPNQGGVTTLGGLRNIPTRNLRTTPQAGGSAGAAGPGALGSTAGTLQSTPQMQNSMTPEEQQILIEAQKDALKQQGDETHKIFPRTELGDILQQENAAQTPPPSPQ